MHRLRQLQLVFSLLTCLLAGAANGATYFVAPCGNNGWAGVTNNCIAPLGPKRTIQAAIDIATHGDTINVMPGVYTELIDLDGKAITLIGLGGPASTIIDGGGAGPVVMCNSLEGPGTVIEGFKITGGNSDEHGGGMFIALGSPTINNCVFQDNYANWWGGGLYAVTSSPTINGCTFIDNYAEVHGGGAFFQYGQPTVTDCTFMNNEGFLWGGGMAFSQTADGATATGCAFSGNRSTVGGGFYAAQGEATVSDCTFNGNTAAAHGGGLELHLMDAAEVSDCTFVSNDVEVGGESRGGAMRITGCAPMVTNCAFQMNSAPFGGGAVSCDAANGTQFTGCTFTDNVNTGCCGASALHCEDTTLSMLGCNFTGNSVSQYGGAIMASASNITLTWCGFQNNEALDWVAYGAAINVVDGSTLDAGLCTFFGNAVGGGGGGAVFGYESTASFQGCTFQDNTSTGASGGGGAIRVEKGSLSLDACTLNNNSAPAGGAVYLEETSGVGIEGTTFDGNTTIGDGGAVYIEDGPITIQNSEFNNNTAGNAGGGLFTASMLITPNAHHPLNMLNTQFQGNYAAVAGGGLCAGTPTNAVGCSFLNNSSQDGGGVIAVGTFADLRFYACRLDANSATGVGGGLMVGAMTSGSSAMLMNTIVCNNTSAFGGGAVMESALGGFLELINSAVVDNIGGGVRISNAATQSVVSNTIIRGNTSGAELIGLTPMIRYSNVEGGAAGAGNIDADPMFINPAVGNYGLTAGSPCIDAGVNWAVPVDALDLDGDEDATELIPYDYDNQPRFADDRATANTGCGGPAVVDIGPYELSGDAIDNVHLGDINTDGVVNGIDLAELLGTWGACQDCCPADLNLDGVVNGVDLAILLGNWG